MNVMFLSYNNYFNRVIRKTNLDGYYSYPHKTFNMNFNPNDGVNTTHIVNWTEKFTPDYCIIVNENNEIVSRWFVADTKRNCGGQYTFSLKRDLIADYKEDILNAPCFIEKGWVNDTDPLVFNKENFACNQIKEGEVLLRDRSYISWIAVYYNPSTKDKMQGSVVTQYASSYTNIGTTLENWSFYTKYGTNGYKLPINETKKFFIAVDMKHTPIETKNTFDCNGKLLSSDDASDNDAQLQYLVPVEKRTKDFIAFQEALQRCIDRNKDDILEKLELYGSENEAFSQFMIYNGLIIKTSDNKFYRIRISNEPSRQTVNNAIVNSGTLYNAINAGFTNGHIWYDNFDGALTDSLRISYSYDVYGVYFEDITSSFGITVDYDFRTIKELKDEPYGIIMFPYKALDPYGRPIEDVSEDVTMQIVRKLAIEGVSASGAKVFDVQIVPYCPFSEIIGTPFVTEISMSFGSLVEDTDYKIIRDSNNKRVSFAVFPDAAMFSKNIDVSTELVRDLHVGQYGNKIDNQCIMYRLCSPNYNGVFELSASKNYGLDYFNVDCTYKPYQPYIHVNPVWKGLYGKSFNDARGLICGGDFTISIMSDAFEQYKLMNKNFEKAFDREIEHLDTTHDINKGAKVSNLVTSTGKGIVGGAIAGANPLTIGVGAVAGLASGITGLVAENKTYEENRDYAIDMHNFQLDNIKAQPNGLNKVTAYTNNNKVFPFIEKYSCTDKEIEIFQDKLKYEGMTINAMGTLNDYLNPNNEETFVKGQLIRLEIADDSHLLYSIYDEVSKGFYTKKGE